MLEFTDLGYLTPNIPIKTSLEIFHKTFVINYSSVERSQLSASYKRYSEDLKAVCELDVLKQWIDGSFVTLVQPRPGDIDIVTFIPSQIIEDHESELKPFLYPQSKINYPGIDGYIVAVHAMETASYIKYQSDALHWQDQFDKTRRTRTGKKLPKGFLEIIY